MFHIRQQLLWKHIVYVVDELKCLSVLLATRYVVGDRFGDMSSPLEHVSHPTGGPIMQHSCFEGYREAGVFVAAALLYRCLIFD